MLFMRDFSQAFLHALKNLLPIIVVVAGFSCWYCASCPTTPSAWRWDY